MRSNAGERGPLSRVRCGIEAAVGGDTYYEISNELAPTIQTALCDPRESGRNAPMRFDRTNRERDQLRRAA